ncbi:MAG: transposase [Spirochaetia bacterium]
MPLPVFLLFQPELDGREISSTHMQERLHEKVRRRSRVVGIFPSSES